ncbi:hypothetical protein EJ04DRAFT_82732 [Polyplosphaeria fusca]|uniref:Uncharacterized protein n=1 Tax=Polyplosphaeria fusca TaxID=682080 RepID=A0A9P4QNS4_9PLEO|nr:hypothetical protein EJ04DRAFT_82732 [Polyplosphaeria fusca]
MTPSHSRSASEETKNSTVSYNMILEHVLQYPGSYEIPLRTMYTLNCTPRAQPLPRDLSRAPTPTGSQGGVSPVSGHSAWNDPEAATMNFTTTLMSHMASLPSQPSSLPPSFIISFVTRCFHPSLTLVDFPQALTALDYLRDLETRRCKEVKAAFDRLGIRPDSFAADIEAVSTQYPGIALWVKNIEGKTKKAEYYYSSLYLGLRRWVMINELSLQPFNKLNCMGMLNTLFPPQGPHSSNKLPAPLLTPQLLREERDSFFEYIRLVQKKGPSVLKSVMDHGKGEDEENGWDSVQRAVDKYLRVAKNMIDDCIATTGTDDFTPVEEARKAKKTDSGVSFGSERRPSTGASLHEMAHTLPHAESKTPTKGLSRLERITREFRRMRVKTRLDVEEIVKVEKPSAADYIPIPSDSKGKKSLKKARSFANIGNLRSANASMTSLAASSRKGSDVMPFNLEEMKRHRKLFEQSAMKHSLNVN